MNVSVSTALRMDASANGGEQQVFFHVPGSSQYENGDGYLY